jgi:hypothetical protein
MRAVLVLALLVASALAEEATVISHDIVLRIDPGSSFVSYDTVQVRGPGRLRVTVPAGVEVTGGDVDVPAGVHERRVRFAGRFEPVGTRGQPVDPRSFVTEGFFVPSSHPSRFTITIGVPPPHHAVAPGRRLDEWEADGLRFVTHAGLLPSDRLVVVTGPWEVSEEEIDGVSCRTYFLARDRQLAADALATLRAEVPRYQELFGPLPGRRFDVVQGIKGFFWRAYSVGSSRVVRSGRIDHALAHSWFGHHVRVDPARGDWTEALTTYFADHGAAERAGDDDAYRARVARGFSLRVHTKADLPLRGFGATHHDRDIGSGKGSMVFHMLARELGRDRFLNAVRHALENYPGDTFGWDGWVTVLGENTDRDLAPWFAPWLDRPGAPILEIGTLKVDEHVVAGTIRQAQAGLAYPLRVPVRVTTAAGTEEHVVLSASKETAFRLTTKAKPRRVEVDPEHHIFRKIPRDRIAPCLAAVRTAGKRIGFGDPSLLEHFDIEPATGEPPPDAALLAVGLPPEIKETLLRDARQQDATLRIESGRFAFRGEVYDQPGDAILFSYRFPGLPPVTFFHGNAAAAYATTADLQRYELDSWVTFRDGKPVRRGVYPADRAVSAKITRARRGEVESLVGDLLYLTDPRHLGREAGTMAAFKLANELRGRMHNAGLQVVPWPSVRIPRGSISGRELVILDGEEKVRLRDAFYPFHASASPRHAPIFRAVVEHPAEDVKDTLVLLPEDAPFELVQHYAEEDAAVVAVVASDEACTKRAREAAWEGAVPPALRRDLATDRTNPRLRVSDLLVRVGAKVVGFPYIYLKPSAAEELKRRGAGGVLRYRIRRSVHETSNLVGVLGNPREQGVLLGAHWDGVGPVGGRTVQAASDNAAGVAVVLWVAARLKRDLDQGKLRRPVVVALFGGNKTGRAGSRQFVAALRSQRCPIARPLHAINVDGVGSLPGKRVHVFGRAHHPELFDVFAHVNKGSGLVIGPPLPASSADHGPLSAAGIPAVTIFSADPHAMNSPLDTVDLVDVDTMRRVARVVYRMARVLASR